MTVIAHAGHWVFQLLYLAPIVALVGALAWAKMKERRDEQHGPDA
jgi:hypothetical protein